MTMQRTTFIGALTLALGIAGCDLFQGKAKPDNPDPTVEIRQIIDTFEQEAEARSVFLSTERIRLVTSERIVRDGQERCGFGFWDDTGQEIQIAINDQCWWQRSSYDREILVFHELGHAALARLHRDDTMPNGTRASIMNGGRIIGLYTSITLDRRPYYLDELFDPDTPTPTWGWD